MHILVSESASEPDAVVLRQMDASGHVFDSYTVPQGRFAETVAALTEESVRWVWDDTTRWYPRLLEQGVSVTKCHDLRLCHAILKRSEWAAGSELAELEHPEWDRAVPIVPGVSPNDTTNTLFDEAEFASWPSDTLQRGGEESADD